jgi:porin
VENSHGENPSAHLIGDLQVASNIDNGNYTYLYEMWYKQQVGKLNIQLGLIDLNAEYLVAEPGGLFFNSSFGIQPSASMNMPVPIFPMNSLGLSFKYDFTESISLQTGLWDGDSGNLDDNPYNTAWSLSKNQGFLSASELHFKHGVSDDSYSGIIKLGFLYHSAKFEDLIDPVPPTSGNMEVHLIAEQNLISKPDGEKGKLDAFTQIGFTPDNKINPFSLFLSAGVNYTGLLFEDASDIFGLALAYAPICKHLADNTSGMLGAETAIELTYAFTLIDKITVQPDFQYIINPGVNENIDNAFVGLLRIVIDN